MQPDRLLSCLSPDAHSGPRLHHSWSHLLYHHRHHATPHRYDKSAFSGRGDRADPSTWPVVAGPLQLVFFEGWMSGFRPVGAAAAAAVEPALAEVDRRLGDYEAAWDSLVDSWLVIRIADPQVQCCNGVGGLH